MNRNKHTDEEMMKVFKYLLVKLKELANDFDNGEIYSVLLMSVILRTLLKTKNEKTVSLIDQLNLNNAMFVDTRKPEGVICGYTFQDGVRNQTISVRRDVYISLLNVNVTNDDGVAHYHFKPILDFLGETKMDTFEKWYNQVVYHIDSEELTRKKLIDCIAEKEGGAHFDDTIGPSAYVNLRNGDAQRLTVNGSVIVFEENPAFLSLRQIAHEVLSTFVDYLPPKE